MKDFFKFLFASCLGMFLAMGLLTLAGVITITSLSKSFTDKKVNTVEGVLTLKLPTSMPELSNNVNVFSFSQNEIIGIHDIIRSIEYAKTDNKIKGIVFAPEWNSLSMAKATLLRDALADFKTSGKFVYAHSDIYAKNAYYIASVADTVALHPMGAVEVNGYGTSILFFTDFLKNIGIEMEIFSVGKFKSAVEPFKLDKMSPENRIQLKAYLEDLYEIYLNDISASRNISVAELRKISNEQLVRNASTAKDYKIVDVITQPAEFDQMVRRALSIEADKEIKSNSIENYFASNKSKINPYKSGADRIAIVYAEGEIHDMSENPGVIYPSLYIEAFDKILEDDKIKAVVLRVNSPGGSALASDKILFSLKRIQDKGIPVVASYGDYAASGGYYISCFADSIVAQANTLTGSIGVFGMIPDMSELAQDKLKFSVDTVKTSEYAVGFSPLTGFSKGEKRIIQSNVENTYDRFLSLVSEGRNLSKDSVDAIGQGRIWSGTDALKIGLVDKIGTLEDAIAMAARMANIEDYRTKDYPSIKDPLTRIIESLTKDSGVDVSEKIKDKTISIFINDYENIKQMVTSKSPYARIPFILVD